MSKSEEQDEPNQRSWHDESPEDVHAEGEHAEDELTEDEVAEDEVAEEEVSAEDDESLVDVEVETSAVNDQDVAEEDEEDEDEEDEDEEDEDEEDEDEEDEDEEDEAYEDEQLDEFDEEDDSEEAEEREVAEVDSSPAEASLEDDEASLEDAEASLEDDEASLEDDESDDDDEAEHEQPVVAQGSEEVEAPVASSLVDLVSDLSAVDRQVYSDPPAGMIRGDRSGHRVIDALAGRVAPFGFGSKRLQAALTAAVEGYLGDGSAFDPHSSQPESPLPNLLQQALGTSLRDLTESIYVEESASIAVERAIRLARNWHDDAYRIISIVDSDHGRTGMTRIASGRPSLHDNRAPMMAGFRHIEADVEQLQEAVDETTAAILVSPIIWQQAGRSLDARFLTAVQNLCDQRNLLFIVDETQVGFASTAHPLVIHAIADVRPDIVVMASGLFGGLPGGITLASRRVTGEGTIDIDRYPLSQTAATAVLQEWIDRDARAGIATRAESFAVELAQRVSEFDFVRDVNVLGLSIGLETDLSSEEIVQVAARYGLHLETAGETAIRLQPPGLIDDQAQAELLETLAESFATIQQATVGIEG